jgi:hypothetical protein
MFALGAGPVPGLLLPEIFPDCIRAKGMAVAMCVHWVSPYRIISHTRKRHWGFMRHPNHAQAHDGSGYSDRSKETCHCCHCAAVVEQPSHLTV